MTDFVRIGARACAAILTANISCQMHLQSVTALPVRHWIEALDESLSPSG